MARGNLTWDDFWRLPESERGERYKDLSDADKFRIRMGGGDYISPRGKDAENASANNKIGLAERKA